MNTKLRIIDIAAPWIITALTAKVAINTFRIKKSALKSIIDTSNLLDILLIIAFIFC